MSDRFFTPDLLGPGEYTLTGPDAHHLATVRRYLPGDRITLFNGDGHDYLAEVVSADRKRTHLTIIAATAADRELGFPLVVASALPKGDRGDFLIEKLTELGVTRFVPLVTARSVVIPKENATEKLRRAVVEASKQCGRNRLMAVEPPQKWEAFAVRTDLPGTRCLLHLMTSGAIRLAELAPTGVRAGVTLAIGPEGGFTEEETQSAIRAGWRAVTLGPRVLRVETAAIAAVAWSVLQDEQ